MIAEIFKPPFDAHEADLEFHREIREASEEGLVALLPFQAVEPWRRALILREIARRQKRPLPTTA